MGSDNGELPRPVYIGLGRLVDSNPKTQFGRSKPSLGLIPGTAQVEVSRVFAEGDRKYGQANWRVDPVSASTYHNAARRHLQQWFDGEDIDLDSEDSVLHLAAACSNLMILLDARACGTLIDDRPKPAPTGDLIRQYTKKEPQDGR